MNEQEVLSPTQIALRRLRRNRIAIAGAFLLVVLYFCAILAGFLSPYSPVEDEFRSDFFHPPTPLHFRDENGAFHWRPFIIGTYLVNPEQLIYSAGTPLHVYYRNPKANTNPYLLDSLESEAPPVLTVKDKSGKLLGTVTTCNETDRDTGIFHCVAAIDPLKITGDRITIQTLQGESADFQVVQQKPQAISENASDVLSLKDGDGRAVNQYCPLLQKYPLRLFVRGWRYHILWIFHSDLHLFGTDEPGHLFLFGTDQSGRDLFSRILHGAQISLTVGLVGVFLTTIFGMLYGGISGYYGGNLDHAMMRFVEVLMSIPGLYLILTLRNMIPDHLQDFYDKLATLGRQTFAWQHNALAAILAAAACLLLFTYYIHRTGQSRTKLFLGTMLILALGSGLWIGRAVLQLLQWILPGTTHLTSEWIYFLIIVILSTVTWAQMSRVIRGMVLSLKEQEYVLAARALGASDFRIITRHILPNTFGYVIVRATLLVPAYILGEVILSFLGVGVQEPVASWGNMLSAAQSIRVLQQFTWILSPGLFLFVTVLAYNFLGDGLRDALDPRKT